MNRLTGKVAVITGAARGQGRSHAITLAANGADIIAIDICAEIPSNSYALATPGDLEETRKLVEETGQRCFAATADVREPAQLRAALKDGVDLLGRIDTVVANAGISPLGRDAPRRAFLDVVNVNLVGVVNTVTEAYPYLTKGASIIAIGSVAAMMKGATDQASSGPGGAGYTHSKRAVAGFVHDLARQLGPDGIRVNAIHPSNCNTDMLQNPSMYKIFRPDLDAPTREDALESFQSLQAIPVPWVEPIDISHAVVFLASDEARYVTGLQMKVDAGAALPHTAPYALI